MSECLQPAAQLAAQPFRRRGLPRGVDLLCASAGLLLLTPVALLIALAVRAADGGPVFYSQKRIGKAFRPFRLLKFRTMVVDADRAGLLTGPQDARVTRPGRVLRRYKLDELPQLINVLLGDMQLVGSRPEVAKYVDMFRPQYALLLREAPGLTDPASIAYRDEESCFAPQQMEEQYIATILPHKLKLSLEYQRRRTVFSDLNMLFRTIARIF